VLIEDNATIRELREVVDVARRSETPYALAEDAQGVPGQVGAPEGDPPGRSV